MSDEDFEALLVAFDALDNAAQKILVSQPFEMTESAARLDAARQEMRTVIHQKLRKRALPVTKVTKLTVL